MPMPPRMAAFVTRHVNPLMIRLVGHFSIVDLEHVGRRSGTVRHTPLMAFRDGDVVTIALTYGPEVQWLSNIRAAGGCRMRMGNAVLTLGPPEVRRPDEGLRRIPQPQRALLRWPIRCRDYVTLPVVSGGA